MLKLYCFNSSHELLNRGSEEYRNIKSKSYNDKLILLIAATDIETKVVLEKLTPIKGYKIVFYWRKESEKFDEIYGDYINVECFY